MSASAAAPDPSFPPSTTLRQKIFLVCFGMMLLAAGLEIGLRLGGWVFTTLQERRNWRALAVQEDVRILCLGESTTAFGGENSYPAQLERLLDSRAKGKRFAVINKGIPGMTTRYILEQLPENLRLYRPHIVLAMMGVNDRQEVNLYRSHLASGGDLLRTLRVYKLVELSIEHLRAKLKMFAAKSEAASLSGQARETAATLAAFQRRIADSPRDINLYLEYINYCIDAGHIDKARGLIKEALAFDPGGVIGLLELSWLYKQRGQYLIAEEALNDALRQNPQNTAQLQYIGYLTRVELGRLYKEQGRLSEAESVFVSLLRDESANAIVLIELGWLYQMQERSDEAIAFFEKALTFDPDQYHAHLELGGLYRLKRNFPRAKMHYYAAYKSRPGLIYAITGLAWIYAEEKDYAKAATVLQSALALSPENFALRACLRGLRKRNPDAKLLNAQFEDMDEYLRSRFNSVTRMNFLKMRDLLLAQNIQLVCVQYPLRSVEPLKRLFRNDPRIVFVDNEKTFRDAVAREGYRALFIDMFAGDFGHCTQKGNRLLAQNVADALAVFLGYR